MRYRASVVAADAGGARAALATITPSQAPTDAGLGLWLGSRVMDDETWSRCLEAVPALGEVKAGISPEGAVSQQAVIARALRWVGAEPVLIVGDGEGEAASALAADVLDEQGFLKVARGMTAPAESRPPTLPWFPGSNGRLWPWTEAPPADFWLGVGRSEPDLGAALAVGDDMGATAWIVVGGSATQRWFTGSRCTTDALTVQDGDSFGRWWWELLAWCHNKGLRIDWGRAFTGLGCHVKMPPRPFDPDSRLPIK